MKDWKTYAIIILAVTVACLYAKQPTVTHIVKSVDLEARAAILVQTMLDGDESLVKKFIDNPDSVDVSDFLLSRARSDFKRLNEQEEIMQRKEIIKHSEEASNRNVKR